MSFWGIEYSSDVSNQGYEYLFKSAVLLFLLIIEYRIRRTQTWFRDFKTIDLGRLLFFFKDNQHDYLITIEMLVSHRALTCSDCDCLLCARYHCSYYLFVSVFLNRKLLFLLEIYCLWGFVYSTGCGYSLKLLCLFNWGDQKYSK